MLWAFFLLEYLVIGRARRRGFPFALGLKISFNSFDFLKHLVFELHVNHARLDDRPNFMFDLL